MNRIPAFSFILHDRFGPERLARSLHSLAAQSLPPGRMELCLLRTGTDDEVVRLVRRFCGRAPSLRLHILETPGTGPARALNIGLEQCTGLLAACLRPGLRLDPAFAMAHLKSFNEHPEADLFCADFVHSGEGGAGMIRLSGVPLRQLRYQDIIGPLPVLTPRARRVCSFRDASPFPCWELGIQAQQAGLRLWRIPRALYSVSARDWRSGGPQQELARLVTRQPGFFHADQVRWALGVLRRRSWAVARDHWRLPTPQEVRGLLERRVREQRLRELGSLPAEVLPGAIPRFNALGA